MTIPTMNHFPAVLIRIRVLREKGEDTLAAEMEQREAGESAEPGMAVQRGRGG